MGLIERIVGFFFGHNRNVVTEVAEVFRENAEASAVRAADLQIAVTNQMAAEFLHPQKGYFDRFMDGVNRLPRPTLAIGTIAMFVAAMADPIWFASRMHGLAQVPEPLWWLLGAIVSFYFGARHQMKGQDFQKAISATVAAKPTIIGNMPSDNAAVDDWRRVYANNPAI